MTWWLVLLIVPAGAYLGFRFAVFDLAHPALGWVVVILVVAGCIALGQTA
jgi:hypothetical protein